MHAAEQGAEVVEALGEGAQATCHGCGVAPAGGGDGVQHQGDDGPAAGLDGDRHEVEPGLVEGAGEGQQGGEVVELVDVLVHEERLEVPEHRGGVRRHGRHLEVRADGQQGGREARRHAVQGALPSPDVPVREEGQEHVGPPPLRIVFQTGGGEDGQALDDAPEPLAENQVLQVGRDGLPLVVVGVGESRQG